MPTLASYAPFKLSGDQAKAAQALEDFLADSKYNILIVKGFAGTGKTSLMKALADYASQAGFDTVLLAATGRAASILQNKTQRQASTVHSHIYQMEDPEDFEDRQKIYFSLKRPYLTRKTLFIVDEASLISNHESTAGILQYGSGRLLSDLLTFVNGHKIVFVGDAAQLPPVNSPLSPALDSGNFRKYFGLEVPEILLEEVMRFPKESAIYQNTHRLRQVIMGNLHPNKFYISASSHPSEIITYPLDSLMLDEYTRLFKTNGPESTIFIAYSNAKVNILNQEARQRLNFRNNPLTKSELLVVSTNNILHQVYNGDLLTVLDYENNTEVRADLHFRKVALLRNDIGGSIQIKGLMLEEILKADKPMLPTEQEKKLIQDFMIRMNKKGITPKKTPDAFKQMLRMDPYLNALRLRYGYALTCHKAQGGEWDDVFIVFERSLFHPGNQGMLYRWIYTALTRAARRIHLTENPLIR